MVVLSQQGRNEPENWVVLEGVGSKRRRWVARLECDTCGVGVHTP